MPVNVPPFYRRSIPVAQQTVALGGTLTFQLPRESLIEEIWIIVEGTITAAATAAVDGLPALISGVTLRGTIAGEDSYMPIAGVSGPQLYELGQFQCGSLASSTGSLGSSAAFYLALPIRCRDYFLTSEALNLFTAIPAFRASDLTLTINFASQAAVDVHATPTFALTSTTCRLEIRDFTRESIPDNWPHLRWSIESQTLASTVVTGTATQFQLPAGGDYSLLLLRSYSAANTKQAAAGTAPFTEPNGSLVLYDLGRNPRENTSYRILSARNLNVIFDSLVAGNACFVFNRGEGNLFRSGMIGTAQANIVLQANTTAAAGSQIQAVYRRVFDYNNLLRIVR